MQIETFPVPGLKLVTLKSFQDARGFFCERFKASQFQEAGLPTSWLQDNFSRSAPRVLRGLHYQWDRPQGKLVTCMQGRILDVAVDIRSQSPTYGQVTRVELSGDVPQWLWIPAAFAHGFCVLGEESADILYKCDAEYNPKGEAGILWSDPSLQIAWPFKEVLVSPRDQQMPHFLDYQKNPRF